MTKENNSLGYIYMYCFNASFYFPRVAIIIVIHEYN